MKPAFVKWICPVDKRYVGLPTVGETDVAAIAEACHTYQLAAATCRVGYTGIRPSCSQSVHGQLIFCVAVLLEEGTDSRRNGLRGAIGQVETVGLIVGICHVVDKESPSPVGFQRPRQFMDGQRVDE